MRGRPRKPRVDVPEIVLTPEQRRRITSLRRYIKRAAASQVRTEIRRGNLAHPSVCVCVDCGEPAVGYDHRDYRHPVAVIPVCTKCNWRRGPARPLVPSRNLHNWTVAQYLAEDVQWLLNTATKTPEIDAEATISGANQGRLKKIRSMIRGGATQTRIAKEIGVSRERVRQLVEQFGLAEMVADARRTERQKVVDEMIHQSLCGWFRERPDLWRAFTILAEQGHSITFTHKTSIRFYLSGVELRIRTRTTSIAPNVGYENRRYHNSTLSTPGCWYLILSPCGGALYPPGGKSSANAPCFCTPRERVVRVHAGVGQIATPALVWDRYGLVPIEKIEAQGRRTSRRRCEGKPGRSLSVMLPDSLAGTVAAAASESGLSISRFVRDVLEAHLSSPTSGEEAA